MRTTIYRSADDLYCINVERECIYHLPLLFQGGSATQISGPALGRGVANWSLNFLIRKKKKKKQNAHTHTLAGVAYWQYCGQRVESSQGHTQSIRWCACVCVGGREREFIWVLKSESSLL